MSMLEELNVQSALDASAGGEERVRDALTEKDGALPLVAREMLLLELWREEVMPKMLELHEGQEEDKLINVIKVRNCCVRVRTLMLLSFGKLCCKVWYTVLFCLAVYDPVQRGQPGQPAGDRLVPLLCM